jgi:co-chaperonin GroES (HSP10)
MIRAYMDNVIVRLLPRETMTPGGLHIPETTRGPNAKQTVRAEVIASGPGWRMRNGRGPLVPNETKPGDVVLIDALAGQDYSMDLNVPRQNKASDWADERGQFRIVREDEIHGVVEP